MAEVVEIAVADDPVLWRSLGFDVEGEECRIGRVTVRLGGPGRGVTGWTLAGANGADLDGLATTDAGAASGRAAGRHPNAVVGIDHVVAFSPDLDRTVAALEAAGLDLRRIREEPTPAGAPRQAFFRLGEVILEVIQQPEDRIEDRDAPARLWGLALAVDDMDATAAVLGDRLGEPRDAVQEGRRIATLRRDAGSSVPLAFMTRA